MEILIYIALFAPLAAAIFAAIFSMKEKNIITGVINSIFIALSTAASITLLYVIDENGARLNLIDWINVGDLNIPFGFVVDRVSAVMMVTVGVVSTAVHVYSIGYMANDKSFNRFFSYLSAFVFSMLILVMSDNFAGLFIGWEGVGLCSWMLIGFWYAKDSASWAANEAFIMNRIADLGMLLGIFMIYWQFGTLQYEAIFAAAADIDTAILQTIGILLFIGAMGKSAQFPLHTWLADAMEGPTPVSALIHAATMVTAGVYLVIRANPIYTNIPDIGFFIASLGAFVAIFAALMALVNNDLKRIIAYSTLSQLGYMFVAAGLGAYWIALFHLVTHAYFKSLLFLGAGNVMHAMNEDLNIKNMGGLFGALKITAVLMIIASVALAGIYPFAGFFSKDKILEVALNENAYILYLTLWAGAGLTAFYSFRLIFIVFFGEASWKERHMHPHEAAKSSLLAMLPLGVLAVIAGFFENIFERFVTQILPEYTFGIAHETVSLMVAATLGIAAFGIFFAFYMYIVRCGFSKKIEQSVIYKFLFNQYYIPQLYQNYIVRPFEAVANFSWKKLDEKLIDASVDMIANMLHQGGDKARRMQSGNLSVMLRWMVFGLGILLLTAVFYQI
ncbi:MAG: NADH-quinone oxidoreductase subunit L [Campylobacteraceae bacterium]|jgi:NADH-quinone oxidoreductase subunit L|nr:NADH-quinone oxidoreductase subunit L [Campylobacteraceae bacterium]